MGYFYFPDETSLRMLNDEEMAALEVGVANLRSRNLPWGFTCDIEDLCFFEDPGMTVENGIMGYTKIFDDKVLLSPDIVKGLTWRSTSGVPNNEVSISIIIHELTHRKQMKWLFGVLWPFLNFPGIDRLTIERWARQNEHAATEILSQIYDDLRK